jgi:cyclin B
MLIACKYEEIYPPIVRDFVYITDNAYTKEEILDMERKMLQVLDFNIQITSSYRFLERYCKIAQVDSLIFNLSRYLIELSLLHCKMLKFSNSNMAASALYLSLKMTRHQSPWTELLVNHTHYTEQGVRPCAKELFILLQEAQTSSLEAVKKKFATPKFGEVSRIRLEHSQQSN